MNPTETASRIVSDHLPSSAPPSAKSPSGSGERLRLIPRGLDLGAMFVVDDEGGSTDPRQKKRQR